MTSTKEEEVDDVDEPLFDEEERRPLIVRLFPEKNYLLKLVTEFYLYSSQVFDCLYCTPIAIK